MSGQPLAPSAPRLTSLDGLRGLAALIVVFHHLALTIPAISGMYTSVAPRPPEVGTATWWLISTPAHLAIAGPESVVVFFVISGLALALPVLRAPRFDWLGYYPQRALRLWLPVAAAVAFATLVILIAPEDPATANSTWLSVSGFESLEWYRPIIALDVLFGDVSLDNPLWSLRWEMIFSLALPIFVTIGVLSRRFWWVTLIGGWLLVVLGFFAGSPSLQYLPVFLLGVVVAVRLRDIEAWTDGLTPLTRGLLGVGVLLASILLLVARWMIWGAAPDATTLVTFAGSLVCLGALGLVLLAVFWPPAGAMLSSAFFRWLGRISFSLYLVHVPIIVAVNAILGQGRQLLAAAISFAVAVVIAELFSRFVERPAHRFAKATGKAASAKFAELTAKE